jgi:hypothetical protein
VSEGERGSSRGGTRGVGAGSPWVFQVLQAPEA